MSEPTLLFDHETARDWLIDLLRSADYGPNDAERTADKILNGEILPSLAGWARDQVRERERRESRLEIREPKDNEL